MKKILSAVLLLLTAVVFTGCGKNNEMQSQQNMQNPPSAEQNQMNMNAQNPNQEEVVVTEETVEEIPNQQ